MLRSREAFAGIVLTRRTMDGFWGRYAAGRNLARDPFAASLQALVERAAGVLTVDVGRESHPSDATRAAWRCRRS
jgi:hypothetical protein